MLKQTFLINTDLKMRKGKIAVQVAHGEVFYMMEKYTGHQYGQLYDNFIKWTTDGLMKKVVLKATEEELHKFIDIYGSTYWMHPVYDKGLTQIPQDSFTCLVIEPLPEEQCHQLFRHLKLL